MSTVPVRWPRGFELTQAGLCPIGHLNEMACSICLYGHWVLCHYPLTCAERRCGHFRWELHELHFEQKRLKADPSAWRVVGGMRVPADVLELFGEEAMRPEARDVVIAKLRAVTRPASEKRMLFGRWARTVGYRPTPQDFEDVAPYPRPRRTTEGGEV